MNRKYMLQLGTAAVLLFALASPSSVAFGQASLTLIFREMDPHVGQSLELRIVDAASGIEETRFSMPEIPMESFDVQIEGLTPGKAYRIDFYADLNGNDRYDPPPTDHAWRIELTDLQVDEEVPFRHTLEFTDIAWPPKIDGRIDRFEYRNEMLDPETGMAVYWQNDDSILHVGLTAPGTGWLSIGFDPENRMQGANIIIAAVDDGESTIEDHYGDSPISHRMDEVDHVIEAAGNEFEGRSILEFAIPLDSGDDRDKPLAPGVEVAIILAYHASSDDLQTRHTARSTTSIVLDE